MPSFSTLRTRVGVGSWSEAVTPTPDLAKPDRPRNIDRRLLADGHEVVAQTDRRDPRVDLDEHYTLIDDFDARFPHEAPSLVECTSLVVRGDVTFGAGIRCVGDVLVDASEPLSIPDGATLTAAEMATP